MDVFRANRTNGHEPLDDERPVKRISTSAGRRLSLITETPNGLLLKTPSTAAAKINVTTTSTYCNDPTHQHVEPVQHGHTNPKKSSLLTVLTGGRHTPGDGNGDRTPNGSALSVSVWSDKDSEKFGHVRHQKHRGYGMWWSRWSRKRLAIIAAIVLAIIVALAVGLAVGLKKKFPSSTPASTTTGNSDPAVMSPGSSPKPGAATDMPPTPTASVAPSALPSGFPLGSYSFTLFLDTVRTECSANAATWSCPPDTVYYSDPQKALTVLNWQISGSAGAYKISSNGQDPTLGTMFQNEKLVLLDSGKDTERYTFLFSRAKSVNMTGSVGDQKGDFSCDYSATTITGSLYTKFAKTYPKDTIAVGDSPNPAWPFAARIEQSAGGGENVPSCKTKSGEKVTGGLKAQDANTLCSCMYRNWTPPRPYK